MNSKLIIAVVSLMVCAAALAEDEPRYSDTMSVPQEASMNDVARIFTGEVNPKCWQCSSPCSAYACCPGSYPQCCWVSGLGCRCCRG